MQDLEETAGMFMCLLHQRGQAHENREPEKTEITHKQPPKKEGKKKKTQKGSGFFPLRVDLGMHRLDLLYVHPILFCVLQSLMYVCPHWPL